MRRRCAAARDTRGHVRRKAPNTVGRRSTTQASMANSPGKSTGRRGQKSTGWRFRSNVAQRLTRMQAASAGALRKMSLLLPGRAVALRRCTATARGS